MARKNNLVLVDFNYLVDLIRNHKQLSKEELEMWEDGLNRIEQNIERPTGYHAVIPEIYFKYKEDPELSDDGLFTRFKKWIKDLF